MFRQIGTPSERDLEDIMGEDYIKEWDIDKVTQWLEEHGWGHIAPRFRDANIYGKKFFQITLSDLVETLPRPITTYADRRRLLNEIRAIGRPADIGPKQRIRDPNIHIDTNLPLMISPATNSSSSGSQSPVRAHTPLSAHLSDTSPITPSSLSRTLNQTHLDSHYEDHVSSPESPVSKSSKFRGSPSSHSGWSMFSKFKSSHQPSPKTESPVTSAPHPVTSSPTLTDTEVEDYAKIAPFIPSRTSSTPDKISKILGSSATSFMGYNVPPKLVGKTVASTQRSMPKSTSYQTSYTRLPKRHAHTPSSPEQRIQVTDDGEVWYSLIVTGLNDAVTIKESILKKMGLKNDPDRYHYFHENGAEPDNPLEPQSLVQLCRMADYSAADRILVKPIKQSTFAYFQEQVWNNFGSHGTDPKHAVISNPQLQEEAVTSPSRAGYDNHPSPHKFTAPDLGVSPSSRRNLKIKDHAGSPTYPRNYLYTTPSSHQNSPDLTHDTSRRVQSRASENMATNGHPYVNQTGFEHKGVQLSDPPTPQFYVDPLDNQHHDPISGYFHDGGDDRFDHHFDNSHGIPTGIYQSDDNGGFSGGENDSASPVATTNAQRPAPCSVSFWAVQPPSMKHSTSDSGVKASFDRLSLSEQSQTPPRPKIITQDLTGSNNTDSAEGTPPQTPTADTGLLRPSSQPSADKFWGERPPVELMQKYLDRYFSGHDLDKEIIVETPPVVEPPNVVPNLNRQPLRHKKSIRVVAKEASRRWSHNNNAPAGPMLRRKSTKMWGQRVVEVKPGQNASETPTVDRAMGYFSKSDAPVCTKIQWIRGALIGKGSFGRVYHAFNVAAGDFIAVKQVEIPHTSGDRLNQQQQDAVDSLYQEINLLKDLDHEHIVEYLGYDRDDSEDVINIFLEYVSGGSISSRLARHGAFEEPVVRHFTRQILLGLEYLHDRSILHRDIKGANILVEENGICKISDFGLSKKNDYEDPYDQNSHMSLRGSIYWMAPEMVKSEKYSAKVDIWSTGCTVIEMFTGQRPWLELNQLAALYNLGHYKTPPLPENISDVARNFLELCFTIEPDKRPTASELLAHPFCKPDVNFEFTDYVSSGKI